MCMFVHMCMRVCACVRTHASMLVCVCERARMHACSYVHVHSCAFVRVRVCVCLCVCENNGNKLTAHVSYPSCSQFLMSLTIRFKVFFWTMILIL